VKVLITGIAGFIGSNLAERLLNEGHEVVGIDNLSYGVREQIPSNSQFHLLDIRDVAIYPLFKAIDVVFHLAAKNCIVDCQLDPVETADINITGQLHVFEAAKQAGVTKVIYAESSAIYEGATIFPTPQSEEKPESFYASSKMCGHLFAQCYRRYHKLNLTGLRYFNVYGPRQDYRRTIPPVMSAFIISLLKDEQPVIYGNGTKQRDFIYIDDVNDFHIMCMQASQTNGKVFNLGSGTSYSISKIYDMICDLLNIHKPAIYKSDLPGEAQRTCADISEALKIGWKPKIDIHTGLQRMIEWIRGNVI